MTCSKSLQNRAPKYDLIRCLRSEWLFPTAAMLFFGYICFSDPFGAAHYWDDYNYAILSYGHAGEFFIYCLLYLSCGALTALHAFSFLFSTKKCNVYLSLPLTRNELYRNRLLAAMPFMVLSSVVPMIISFIGNKLQYTVTPECIRAMLFISLALLSLMLLGFGIGSVFAVSTGNIFEAAAYSALVFFLPTIAFNSVEQIMKNLINGVAISPKWSLRFAAYCFQPTTALKRADPINSFQDVIYSISNQATGEKAKTAAAADFMPMIAWFILFAVLTVMAKKLLIRRKAETAGAFGSNKAAVIFSAAVLSLGAFAVLTNLSNKSELLVTVLCIVLPALIYIVLVALVFRNKDDIRRNLKGMAVAAVLSLAVIITCNTNAFGYYTSVPERDNIESVILCPAASGDFLKTDYTEGGYIGQSPALYGQMTAAADIDFVYELHKQTVKSLDKGDNNIGFIYKLKDGRIVVRYYRGVSSAAARESLKAVETEWYRNTAYRILTAEGFDLEKEQSELGMIETEDYFSFEGAEWDRKDYIITLTDEFLNLPAIICNSTLTKGELMKNIMSKKELDEFKRVMASELVSLKAEDIFCPKEKIRFYITYTLEYNQEKDKLSFAHSYYRFIPIYPAMTKTLALIEKYNFSLEDVTAEDIKSIKVLPYKTALENDGFVNSDIFHAVDKRMLIDRINDSESEYEYSDFTYKNKSDIVTYEDRATIEKYFNSFRGSYAPLDDEGYMVRFVLRDDTFFYGFVAE